MRIVVFMTKSDRQNETRCHVEKTQHSQFMMNLPRINSTSSNKLYLAIRLSLRVHKLVKSSKS